MWIKTQDVIFDIIKEMNLLFIVKNKLLMLIKIKNLIHVEIIVYYPLQQTVVILDNKVIQEEFGIKVFFFIMIEFFINAKAEDILNPNTVFLFEILDFNHQALVYKDTDIYDKDNFYRVAWGNLFYYLGFLRPIGIGKNHLGKSKI